MDVNQSLVTYDIRVRGWLFAAVWIVWPLLMALDSKGGGIFLWPLFSVGMAVDQVSLYLKERKIMSNPSSTQGTIIVPTSKVRIYPFSYRFAADNGGEYEGHSLSRGGHTLALEGERVSIIYNRNQPSQNKAACDFRFYLTA